MNAADAEQLIIESFRIGGSPPTDTIESTIRSGEADCLYALARSKIGRSDFNVAESLLSQCLRINPNHAASLHALATLQMKTDRQEEASQSLQKCLQFAPYSLSALRDLIRVSIATAKFDTAEQQIAILHKRNPNEASRISKYADYLSRFDAILLADCNSKIWVPITGRQFENELSIINGTLPEKWLLRTLSELGSGGTLLEIGSGNGFFTASASARSLFNNIIPIEPRMPASSSYEDIKAKNPCTHISLEHLHAIPGDGEIKLEIYQNSDLSESPIPNASSGYKTQSIQNLIDGPINCLISHWHLLSFPMIRAASEFLSITRPNCILRVSREERRALLQQMKSNGYNLVAAYTSDDRSTEYGVFTPNKA